MTKETLQDTYLRRARENISRPSKQQCHHDYLYDKDFKVYVCLSCGYESKKGNVLMDKK